MGRGCYPRHHTGRVAYNPLPEVVAPGIGRAALGVVMTCVGLLSALEAHVSPCCRVQSVRPLCA
eukprot:9027041-Heterocapsa_arctica.AAC.1